MIYDEMYLPKISVVMSVFNGSRFLSKAIKSVLNQSMNDFEFIIIDDGSTDDSLKIIQEFAVKDDRIRVVINKENIGLANSLNKGIDLAVGKYIARMDADDITVPDRFEKQMTFLENNPKIFVLGGSLRYLEEDGTLGLVSGYPLSSGLIKWQLFFGNPMAHDAVTFRRELFSKHGIRYDGNLRTTQDFDLWVKIGSNFQMANLPDVLLYYRQHPDAVSHNGHELQKKNNLEIRKKLIEETIKMRIAYEVIEATKKPFPVRDTSVALRAITLILILKKKMRISRLDKIDRNFIRQDINYRIGKIIQNSENGSLSFFLKMYLKIRAILSL